MTQAGQLHPGPRAVIPVIGMFWERGDGATAGNLSFQSIFQYVLNPSFPDFAFFVVVFQNLGVNARSLG